MQDQFTTAEGAIWNLTADALSPSKGNTVKWGIVKVTSTTSGSGQSATTTNKVQFTENEAMLAEGQNTTDKVTIAAVEFDEQ